MWCSGARRLLNPVPHKATISILVKVNHNEHFFPYSSNQVCRLNSHSSFIWLKLQRKRLIKLCDAFHTRPFEAFLFDHFLKTQNTISEEANKDYHVAGIRDEWAWKRFSIWLHQSFRHGKSPLCQVSLRTIEASVLPFTSVPDSVHPDVISSKSSINDPLGDNFDAEKTCNIYLTEWEGWKRTSKLKFTKDKMYCKDRTGSGCGCGQNVCDFNASFSF